MLSRFGQNVAMRLEDAYRVLDLPLSASEEQVKAAHRDLTKVWHPDRFAHDSDMQRKAEERLKLINEALETIRAGGGRERAPRSQKEAVPRLLIWIFFFVFLALFVLARRPTPGGVIIAAALFIAAFFLIRRMSRTGQGS